jgi:hypothetical protein
MNHIKECTTSKLVPIVFRVGCKLNGSLRFSFHRFTIISVKTLLPIINPCVSTKYYDRSFKMSISSLENVLPGGAVHSFSTWKSKVEIQLVLFFAWFWFLTSFRFFASNSYLKPSLLFFETFISSETIFHFFGKSKIGTN